MTGDFFLTQWIFLGMRWLYENVVSNNIFLTILISTILLRLVTLFSDVKQRKSSAKLTELQPQIAKLQQQYKNDPQRLQQEQSKLMKASGVSMFSGCLPMLFTMVFLFCFIAAFRFWGYEQNVKVLIEMSDNISATMQAEGYTDKTDSSADCLAKLATLSEEEQNDVFSKVAISETFNNSQFLWIRNIWQPDNGFSSVVVPAKTFFGAGYKQTKKLIYFKDHPDDKEELAKLGIFYDLGDYKNLSKEEQTKLRENAVANYNYLMEPISRAHEGYNNGWFILPVLATLFQLLYAFYNSKQTAKTAGAAQANGSMKFMLYFMPILSFIFCLSYTSAFAIYWTLSSITMLIVNIILSKVMKPKKSNGQNA